jgi:CBS domain-containing protein
MSGLCRRPKIEAVTEKGVGMRVDDLMTREVVSVSPGTTLKEVAAKLVEHRISGLPVCDTDGTVLGVVSEADILYRERGPAEREGLLARLFEEGLATETRKAAARTADDAMSTPPITILAYRTVSTAARTMLEHRVKRLPVVDIGGHLIGIVTRADLVRAFVRSDEEIEREIREEVVERTLWSGPNSVDVAVKGGEVELTGEVETEGDLDLLERLVAQVPGVVEVSAAITCRSEDRARSVARR